MGIRKNAINAKLRLDILKIMIENEFKEYAKIKYTGRRYKVIADVEYSNGEKLTVEYDSSSLLPLLTVSDDLFEVQSELFVTHLVKEVKDRVRNQIACRVIDEYYWKF